MAGLEVLAEAFAAQNGNYFAATVAQHCAMVMGPRDRRSSAESGDTVASPLW